MWHDKKNPAAWHILTCNPESQFLRIHHSQIYCKFKKTRTCLYVGKKTPPFLRAYFLANEIFIAFVCVILKPCSASRAAPACTSFSNSTNAMSWRPGTRRTSLKPGNLKRRDQQLGSAYNRHKRAKLDVENGLLLTGWRAWTAWARWSPPASWWGRGCDWGDFLQPTSTHWISESINQKNINLLNSMKTQHALSQNTTCWGICPGICPGIIWPGGMAPGGIWPGAIPGGGIMPGGGM